MAHGPTATAGDERLIAGAMSGTSADGVDVAIVRVAGRGVDMTAGLLHHHHHPYDADLRRAIFTVREAGHAGLSVLARLGRDVSLAYATAVRDALAAAGVAASDLAAVAAHGQTLYHAPPDTIQWLNPALVAAEVGCPVVSDFRRADCAAGGQGAPLVPFADYILFRHNTLPRAVVNIGGIANITCLWAAGPLDRVWAFDTGPGNCISDFLMRQLDPSGPGVDIDGQLAAEGRVVPELYELLRQDPFFVKLGPKSTDGPSMIAMYQNARRQVRRDLSLADQLATACALTVGQIARALFVFGGQFFGQMIVSGGGTRNRAVMEGLRQRLGDESIRTTDEFGIPSTAKEALAFALLAAATLDGVPSNVPSATGARRPVVLGSITPKP